MCLAVGVHVGLQEINPPAEETIWLAFTRIPT